MLQVAAAEFGHGQQPAPQRFPGVIQSDQRVEVDAGPRPWPTRAWSPTSRGPTHPARATTRAARTAAGTAGTAEAGAHWRLESPRWRRGG